MLAIENLKNHFIFALKTFKFTFGRNLQMKIKGNSSITYNQKENFEVIIPRGLCKR